MPLSGLGSASQRETRTRGRATPRGSRPRALVGCLTRLPIPAGALRTSAVEAARRAPQRPQSQAGTSRRCGTSTAVCDCLVGQQLPNLKLLTHLLIPWPFLLFVCGAGKGFRMERGFPRNCPICPVDENTVPSPKRNSSRCVSCLPRLQQLESFEQIHLEGDHLECNDKAHFTHSRHYLSGPW